MRETKQAEKETMPKQQREITVEIPGYQKLKMRYLILDYNGTIALDGTLQKGVAERLQQLSEQLEIYIVTADTHGTVRKLCQQLPVQIHTFPTSEAAEEKRKIVETLGADYCVCIGNGIMISGQTSQSACAFCTLIAARITALVCILAISG